MSEEDKKKKYEEFNEDNTIIKEEELELSIIGKVLITSNGSAGVKASSTLIGNAKILVSVVTSSMKEDAGFAEIIMEAAEQYAMSALASEIFDEEVEDIDDDTKDQLKLSKLFKGLKPDTEC